MKYSWLIITTLLFFLAVNTVYFWEGSLGILAIPEFIIFGLVFIILAGVFFRQFHLAVKEKFTVKVRLFSIAFLGIVLCLTYIFPKGVVNFDKLNGKDLLVAQREGIANCTTILKLKENNRFIERGICFGITEIKGSYTIKNDTVFFKNIEFGRNEKEFCEFAVIQPSKFYNDKKHFDLVKYKNANDTSGYRLLITKNDLQQLTAIKNKRKS